MLKYAALLAMSLTLLACDAPASSPFAAGDVAFRPWDGVHYSSSYLGTHRLEHVDVQGGIYSKIKLGPGSSVTLVGENTTKVIKPYELVGAEMAIHGRFGQVDVIGEVVVLDIDAKTSPFHVVLEMIDPAFQLCGEEDGVLIIAKAGGCPDDDA